jgi:hypothetical protein
MRSAVSKEEHETLQRGDCPVCQQRGFVVGPIGGNNINIECANLSCRERFNVTMFSGAVIHAHRIEKRSEGGHAWPSEPLQ